MSGAALTPSAVRDGDPAALAALCAVRGPSVLAYCREVAGDAETVAAAGDAFAAFRAAVVAAGEPASLNPEALLVSATRHAAARRAAGAGSGVCAEVPELLAARAERTISLADLERLEVHLLGCHPCRAPVARFKAAQRAYRDPPETSVDPAVSAQIIAALLAAAPVPPANGAEQPGVAGEAADGARPVEQPTLEFSPPGMLGPELDAAAPAGDASEPARPPGRRGATHALLGALGLGSSAVDLQPEPPPDEPGPKPADRPARPLAGARERTTGEVAPPTTGNAPATGTTGARPPRLRRASASRPRRERPRAASWLALVLPFALVLVALLVALVIAGVLGGSDPASSPRVAVPAPAPEDARTPEIVVVSGAKGASAEEVEAAKARVRARARLGREGALGDAGAATAGAAASATTPPRDAPAPQRAGGSAGGSSAADRSRDAGDAAPADARRDDEDAAATDAEQDPSAPDAPDSTPPPSSGTSP